MITVSIVGGLGNQMFQYAFAYSVSKKTKKSFDIDISDFEDCEHCRPYQLNIFKIKDKFTHYRVKRKKRNLLNGIIKKIKIIAYKLLNRGYFYQEGNCHFDANVFNIKNNTYFSGYWQSELYFRESRNDLLKQFTLKDPLHIKSQQYKEGILLNNAVSLHIRRGDYVESEETNAFHGICSLGYYQEAVEYVTQNISEACFYIFSDDLIWAKDNLDFIKNKVFVDLDGSVPDHEEMYLMSVCKHNIIANSSFSWWGAWLNQNNEKIVIAPKQWFNDTSINTTDVTPDDWVRL
ncbi:MAG: O-antigen biosynthesis glycosyltransferase WbnK [Catillopecten margaritatus gill symbiont]|uniref:O-antigen biosynthesis glycosyltransferase WbnK n=1 Tax=Catillopecten margaritatus gill symbiont TaxID=3083288 RepID=A0AAU6PFX5_9GAMM